MIMIQTVIALQPPTPTVLSFSSNQPFFSVNHSESGCVYGRSLKDEPLGKAGARFFYSPDGLAIMKLTVSKH